MMAGAGGGGNARTVSYDDLEMRETAYGPTASSLNPLKSQHWPAQ